jgi:hypothetical protein
MIPPWTYSWKNPKGRCFVVDLSASAGGESKGIFHRRLTQTDADGQRPAAHSAAGIFSPATCGVEIPDRCAMKVWPCRLAFFQL